MSNKLRTITFYEVEESLAKLMFYIKASLNFKKYENYKGILKEMLEIVETWVKYYVDNRNLLSMTDEEVVKINELYNQIPVESFILEDYFDEIDIWLTVVIYYGSCPINEEFDESFIKRKGINRMGKYNDR